MTSVLKHKSELRFERSEPAYRLMPRIIPRIILIQGAGPSSGRRLITSLVISWVPFLVFSRFEGRTRGPTEASPTPGDSISPATAEAGALFLSGSVALGKSEL